jgi:hypothetical protein
MASKVEVFAFQPKRGGTTTVANSATATAQVVLPPDCDTVQLTNSSATAISFVRVTSYLDEGSPPADAAANAPTATADIPILPASMIRVGVGEGYKIIRTIASAADGNIYITPGTGL